MIRPLYSNKRNSKKKNLQRTMSSTPSGESASDAETVGRLTMMQKSIESQIQKLEDEYTKMENLIRSSETSNSDCTHSKMVHAPHWDQVIQHIRNGQEEEAIYSLVRVVQRLLDEKATKKTLNEKANKTYVDDLFERVSKGVQENLQKSADESLNVLQVRIQAIQQKIEDIRRYMSNELSQISHTIDKLKQPDSTSGFTSARNEADNQVPKINL